MKTYKRVLTIAGSDSGGGAGIQADIKTISAIGCYASSAITCITAQNTLGVQAVEPIAVRVIELQIRMILEDIGADAIKIGMLGSPEIAHAVVDILKYYPAIPVVLDPVLIATSGDVLTTTETISVITNELMPLATITTPNLAEAKSLSGYDDDRCWEVLRAKGARALLLKGGHGSDDILVDTLFTSTAAVVRFENERIDTVNTHGTGCTLSYAIASYIALGESLNDSVTMGVKYVHKAIATAADYELGKGHGPVYHFFRYW